MNNESTTIHQSKGPSPLPLLPLLAICLIGSSTEYCWAAGEAVFVPYLSRHSVQDRIVSLVYVGNPILGVWVQPLLGKWSDALNRRVVFVVGLALLGSLGVVAMLCAESICHVLGWDNTMYDDHDEEDNNNSQGDDRSFHMSTIAMIFIAFSLSDICYDCLLIPGRALLDDLTVPYKMSEEANALFTGFQLGGRLVALLVVSSEMTFSGFWGLYSGEDGHFYAVLSSNVLYLMGTVVLVLLWVTDIGSTPVLFEEHDVDDRISEEMDDDCETDEFIDNYKQALVTNGNDHAEYHDDTVRLSHYMSNKTNYQPLSFSCNEEQQEHSLVTLNSSVSSMIFCNYKPDAAVLLCVVQAVGWTAITAQSFFWTSWRGEQIGSIDLALQGFVGIVISALLPIANKHIGAATVWLGSELFFHILMISIAFTNVDGYAPRIISATCGINYAVHATNGLIVAADVVADPSKRARTIAMVNNALPMGQLITAIFGGTIAQYFDGFRNVFISFGIVGCIVTALVWIVSLRQGLFAKNESS